MRFLKASISHSRATLAILTLIVLAGIVSSRLLPIEVSPNVEVPVVFVSIPHEGISPEDGVRLLAKPVEAEMQSVEGVKHIATTTREGLAYVVVEFEIERDNDAAVQDVRTAVDRARAKFPSDTEEPIVEEIAAADMPALIVNFSGDGAQERTLYQIARRLQDKIEALPPVLEANLTGAREEVVEAIIDPNKLERYNLLGEELYQAVLNNNRLIPAGEYDTAQGRFGVKVPALLESRSDIYNLPIRYDEDGVVTLGDIAEVRRTFKDRTGFSHINGKRAIGLQIFKRTKFNSIDAVQAIRELIEAERANIPAGVEISYMSDQSEMSQEMISELSGNILTAVVLVLILVVAALGLRSGMLVGFGIPFSLLGAATILVSLGFTFNFMVAFGLLLALGMLIDGAIVVVEYADRQRNLGHSVMDSYLTAARRMFLPVLASTGTTLMAFLPLMLWPGVSGQFMSYLPVTVFSVLAWSLVYALFFAPVLGVIFGQRSKLKTEKVILEPDNDWPSKMTRLGDSYSGLVGGFVRRPGSVLVGTLILLITIFMLYGTFGRGVMFFVDTENKFGIGSLRAQGNLSIDEKERLVKPIEDRLLSMPEVKEVYAASGGHSMNPMGDKYNDEIAEFFIELVDVKERDKSSQQVYREIRENTADLPGVFFTIKVNEDGPPTGRDIQLELSSDNQQKLFETARMVREHLENNMEGVRDIEDTTPLPGIEWQIEVDRAQAAMLGVDVNKVGQMVQLITNGIKLGEYRPDDAEEELDIRVRYPASERGLSALDKIRVTTSQGPVPVSSFVQRTPQQKVDKIERYDLIQVAHVKANVEDGILADDKVKELEEWLATADIDPEVGYTFRGANLEQEESGAFLAVAGALALFLMFIVLVMQFNSFYQAGLILSAVVMSTAGVMLGLTFSQQPFSIIMTGVGIVALAGIVVNNNIVLIDTYNHLRRERPEMSPIEASHLAAVLRLRPVLLTTVTTVVGLMPLANGFSVDFIARTMSMGSGVTSWWTPLASAIVDGLIFSTLLTLLVTPALLVLPYTLKRFVKRKMGKPVEVDMASAAPQK